MAQIFKQHDPRNDLRIAQGVALQFNKEDMLASSQLARLARPRCNALAALTRYTVLSRPPRQGLCNFRFCSNTKSYISLFYFFLAIFRKYINLMIFQKHKKETLGILVLILKEKNIFPCFLITCFCYSLIFIYKWNILFYALSSAYCIGYNWWWCITLAI